MHRNADNFPYACVRYEIFVCFQLAMPVHSSSAASSSSSFFSSLAIKVFASIIGIQNAPKTDFQQKLSVLYGLNAFFDSLISIKFAYTVYELCTGESTASAYSAKGWFFVFVFFVRITMHSTDNGSDCVVFVEFSRSRSLYLSHAVFALPSTGPEKKTNKTTTKNKQTNRCDFLSNDQPPCATFRFSTCLFYHFIGFYFSFL